MSSTGGDVHDREGQVGKAGNPIRHNPHEKLAMATDVTRILGNVFLAADLQPIAGGSPCTTCGPPADKLSSRGSALGS